MNFKKLIVPLLVCVVVAPAWSQNKGKALAKTVDAVISRQAVKQVPGKVITTRTGTYFYHPVFGYVPSTKIPYGYPTLYFAAWETLPTQDDDFIQRAPLFEHQADPIRVGFRQPFELGEDIDLPAITQAGYLWLVAHPGKSLEKNPYLYDWAQLHLKQAQRESFPSERMMWEFPNYFLLKRLVRGNFTPISYATLYELTPVYPKHITLGKYGFPVKTADAAYADLLDAYLMLSNPNEMGAYNTYGEYTPFVLTPEEHAAAGKLLALRVQGEKLPANPTPRDLLELAYNRLETHTAPYSQIDIEDIQSGIYKAYPNYQNTQLYQTIKGMIKDQIPLESFHNGYYTLENVDMTHLIVLDAVMGGVNQQDLMEVRRALSAFDKLCAQVHPNDEQAIAHLAVLRKNLRVVFDPFIRFFEEEEIDWAAGQAPQWQKADLASYAWSVLVGRDIRDLVGRNWKERY